jgi:hypothetical protein
MFTAKELANLGTIKYSVIPTLVYGRIQPICGMVLGINLENRATVYYLSADDHGRQGNWVSELFDNADDLIKALKFPKLPTIKNFEDLKNIKTQFEKMLDS